MCVCKPILTRHGALCGCADERADERVPRSSSERCKRPFREHVPHWLSGTLDFTWRLQDRVYGLPEYPDRFADSNLPLLDTGCRRQEKISAAELGARTWGSVGYWQSIRRYVPQAVSQCRLARVFFRPCVLVAVTTDQRLTQSSRFSFPCPVQLRA